MTEIRIQIPGELAKATATRPDAALRVSFRDDMQVSVRQSSNSYSFALFDGLPKPRVISWPNFAGKIALPPEAEWARPVRNALQYYVNRHKGPTGQIELPFRGLNIEIRNEIEAKTLTLLSIIAGMHSTGEWGKIPEMELAEWLEDLD